MFLFFFVLLVFPKVFTTQNKHSRKPNIPKKTKENPNNLRENQTTNVFKGFRLTLGYVFVGFPEGFYKTNKTLEKTTNTTENQQNLLENQQKQKKKTYPRVSLKPLKTLYVWFSRRFCWFSLVVFCIFGFLECFVGFVKTLGKTKHTKDHNKNLRENQQNKNNKPISKGESETFKNFVFLVFPKCLLVCFGFLLYFWFSRMFCWFCKKPLGKPNIQKNTTNIFGKTNKTKKQTHIQG